MNRLTRITIWAGFALLAASAPLGATCAANSGVYDSSATQTGPTTWTYDYLVLNGCNFSGQQLLTDFYIPYFPDAGIANITVPAPDSDFDPAVTWTYTIEPGNNLFNLAGAGAIDFQVTSQTEVQQGTFVTGVGYYGSSDFSYTSSFAPVEGPYAITQTQYDGGLYDTAATTFGDPSIPASPDTLAALNATATPEPGFLWLVAIGCSMMIAFKISRRRFGLRATAAVSPRAH